MKRTKKEILANPIEVEGTVYTSIMIQEMSNEDVKMLMSFCETKKQLNFIKRHCHESLHPRIERLIAIVDPITTTDRPEAEMNL